MHASLRPLLLLETGGPNPVGVARLSPATSPHDYSFCFRRRDKGLFTRAVPEADWFPTARLFQDRAAENKKKNWGVGATSYKQATPPGFQQTGDHRNSSSALGDLGNDKAFTPLHLSYAPGTPANPYHQGNADGEAA